MITRLLPRAEWSRLAGTELEVAAPLLPAEAVVLVVEDEGTIAGCWALTPYWHVEGLYVAPEHRGRSAVFRRLVAGMRASLDAIGERVVLTAATDAPVQAMLVAAGARALPGVHFVVPVRKGS